MTTATTAAEPARHDDGQRSPSPCRLLRSVGGLVPRLPGMLLEAVKYVAQRDNVDDVGVVVRTDSPDGPDPARPWPGDPATVLRRSAGRGDLYQRVYRIEITDPQIGPDELIAFLIDDPNLASPLRISVFEERSGERRDGAEFAVRMPGPWDAPVRIVERTDTSFSFVTLRGHMEAGEIGFRADWGDDGRLVFTIESWARSGDRLYHWVYDLVPLTKQVQLHMWVHVCERVAIIAGGTPAGKVSVTTHRWKEAGDG